VALAVVLGACVTPAPAPTVAPGFTLTDLSGKKVALSDFRGHPVLVDFWATWCEPCRMSIPVYAKLFNERRGSGFTVVGIDEDDEKIDVAAFAQKNSIPYPLLRDPKRAAFNSLRVRGLPTAFLIDANGRIVRRWDTFNDGTLFEVEAALGALGTKAEKVE
jgi:peroxiredoxin